MIFDIFKVQKVNVDIDFENLYQVIKEELGITPEEYDDIEDYCLAISEHFMCNETEYLTECGINFVDNSDDSQPYYDIEANDKVLVDIYNAFENYVFDQYKK